MKTFRKILLILCLGFFVFAIGFCGYYSFVTYDVSLQTEKLLLPDTQIVIYDETGQKVSGASSFQTRDIVRIDTLPKYLPAAFVNVEDKRFYRHNGFDGVGIGRAIFKNLFSGSFKQGASTISQQLIKNTHLSMEKTVARKLKEVKLTRQLERKYSKKEILETYLNTIYFGHNCYGIANAAQVYFDKPASSLSLAESALLAGLVKAPNHYSPFKNPEKAYARRKTVLQVMLAQKSITESEYKNAVNADLPTTFYKNEAKSYAHFAIEEMDQILENLSLTSAGRIELFTHLNPSIQTALEVSSKKRESDVSLIVLHNKSHGIQGYYSTIASGRRSPASLIKPLLVYAPAIENGIISPATLILDEKTSFGNYSPKNYNDKYYGYVSVRESLEKSLNVPSVKTLNALGVENAAYYGDKMALEVPENDRNLALALGGMEYGYPFKDLISAYTVFPNSGVFSPCRFIKEIRRNGVTVYKQNDSQCNVFSPETAYLITDILKGAVKNGTGKALKDLPFSVAAKTGTGGEKDGNRDAYTVAYTSEHTIGVWCGNANNTPIETTGGGTPAKMCKNALEQLYCNSYPTEFEKPQGVKEIMLDRISYENEHRILRSDTIAPLAFQKKELFWEKYPPTAQSSLFSKPTVATPNICLTEKGVRIYFDSSQPQYYRYKLLRKTGGKQEIIYDGAAFQEAWDRNLYPNTRYEYTLIAYYQTHEGVPVQLPIIYTGNERILPPITNKPWWTE